MPENEIIQQLNETANNKELLAETLEIIKAKADNEQAISHCLKSAQGLQLMMADDKTIAANLLRCLPENQDFKLKTVSPASQQEIWVILRKAKRLEELYENFKNLRYRPIEDWQKNLLSAQAENLRKMFFALTQDLRPIFILLAHHWELMKNINQQNPEAQRKYSQSAIEILAPLAYGLGMLQVKGQLEDFAFPALYPKEYDWLLDNVKQKYEERQQYLENLQKDLPVLLRKEKIKFLDIHKRAKYYFSLYQKLLRNEMDLGKIYDLVALRVLVPTVEQCYKTLGSLHKLWTPLPGRIKDYISQPKLNGYRSLHTTVWAKDNQITEFQIKTPQMHQEAEYGASAHLSYKQHQPSLVYKYQNYWLDHLRQWQEETKNPQIISSYLQTELLKDNIFVFTPHGDIINLAKDSTPVDFAYAIHSNIGEHCQGAKVNNIMATLDKTLKSGDTVEIIANKSQTPSERWLRFVKTKKAQERIKKFLQKQEGLEPAKKPKLLETITKGLTEKMEQLKKMLPVLPLKKREPQVIIGGQAQISYKLGRCCLPKTGDSIAAFINQGRSATVHKLDCKNLKFQQQKSPNNVMQAEWK